MKLQELTENEYERSSAVQDIKDATSSAWLELQKLKDPNEEYTYLAGNEEAIRHAKDILEKLQVATEKFKETDKNLSDWIMEQIAIAHDAISIDFDETIVMINSIGNMLDKY